MAHILIKRRWGRAALSDRAIFRRSDCQNRNDLDQTGKILRILHPVSGVAALEAALTLPALCSLIFFTLELVRINITQAAINAICVEMTFDFIATRSWNNFEAIMNKHRPSFIPPMGSDGWYTVRFSIDSWSSFNTMMTINAYGGASIHYPGKGYGWSMFDGASPNYNRHSICIPVNGIDIHCGPDWGPTRNYLQNNNFPSERAFVLDVTVAYPFSNSFVKKMFHGGSNSRFCGGHVVTSNGTPGADAGKYIIWARGVGIVN